ncbi:hypothetical protein [uncultured Winogradskyella sp.]|uniref:hypothetical protein n=1 Tax=uncultured Winogradskyella sp. TaxID=395353 RepID=UPI0030D855DF
MAIKVNNTQNFVDDITSIFIWPANAIKNEAKANIIDISNRFIYTNAMVRLRLPIVFL